MRADAVTPVLLAIIQENANGKPSAANGLFMMVAFFSRAVAILIVGFLGDIMGLQYMYVACSVVGLAALPFLMKLKN